MTVSEYDALWAARGCLGEGGPTQSEEVTAAYLWAIMHRCLLFGNSMSFGGMWKAFSQPINPDWRETGKFCRPGGLYHATESCSVARLARRDKLAQTIWDHLPREIVFRVRSFQTGTLDRPDHWATLRRGRVSNWGSHKTMKHLSKDYPHGYELAGEWFFEDPHLLAGVVEVIR
jgi:hypothetical protein